MTEKERRIPDQSLPMQAIETIGGALEGPGSLVRNTILKGIGAAGGEDHSIDYSSIMNGKDYMEAHELIDAGVKLLGFDEGYETKGDDWLESTMKFGAELAVDIATDPITYIPIYGQATAIGKGFGRLMKHITPDVAKKASPWVYKGLVRHAEKSALSTATGAAVGAMAPVEEDSNNQIWERIRNAGIGASVVFAGSPVSKGIISSVKYGSDEAVDALYKHAHPDVVKTFKNFLSPSQARNEAKAAKTRFAGHSREVRKMNFQLLKEFGEKEVEIAIKTFDDWVPKLTKERNEIYEKINFSKMSKKEEYNLRNSITKDLNEKAIEDIKATGAWTPAMDRLIERNRAILEMYNGAVSKYHKNHVPLTGIDIHTPEIFDKDSLGDNLSRATAGFVKRTDEGAIRTGGLSAAERLEEEANRIIFPMMNQRERDAIKYMTKLRNTAPKDARYVFGKESLEKFDEITGDMKGAMLGLSHSWVKNNFYENTMRTFIEHGFISAAKVAGLQGQAALSRIPKIGKFLENDLVKDLKQIISTEEAATKYLQYSDKTGLAQLGVEYGTLNGGFFREILGDITDKQTRNLMVARHGEKGLAEKIAKHTEKGHVAKTKDAILDTARKVVGDTGSIMENATRANSLEAFVKANATKAQRKLIKKHGYMDARKFDPDLDRVYKKSNKMVDDTFFDYSDLSLGEEQIMKRLFPFYSFYSKNMLYWGDKVSHKIAHTSKALKVPMTMVNYDPNMPLHEKMRLTEYERSIPHGKDDEGNTITAGGFSMTDYMEALENPSSYIQGKIHPLISGGASVAHILGNKVGAFSEGPKDSLGRELLISNNKKKRIRAPYYSERKIALIDEMLGSPFGTIKTPEGKLRVTGDFVPTLGAIANMAPIPIIDTVADLASRGDVESKLSTVKTANPDLKQRISTIGRNKQAIKEPFQSFVKDNMVKHKVVNYRNRDIDPAAQANQAAIYTDDRLGREADQLHAQELQLKAKGSPYINEVKVAKSAWNNLGLKSSPSLINNLADIEGFIERARVLGSGKHKERSYSIGHSIYDVYPMTYGDHKKGQKIGPHDTMDRTEAALQLAAFVGRSEKKLDRVLDREDVQITQGIYDAFVHSAYNTGDGWLRKFDGNLAEYFMRLPSTVNNVPHRGLVNRRIKEFNMAKEDADRILQESIQAINTSHMSPAKKLTATRKVYKTYYFPDTYFPLGQEDKLEMPLRALDF